MKEILEKLTSYNLFNYLLPGVLFAIILDGVTSYSLIQDDIIVGAFVYYFAGLVVSRVGSLVIEPLLKKVGFLNFVPYPEYAAAIKVDPTIEILSEANNMYRSFTALFLLLIFAKTYEMIAIAKHIPENLVLPSVVVILSILFLLSYRKQTTYVVKRINSTKK
jgi:hypothetical protein